MARSRDLEARERILAATRDLIREQGPLQVGVDAIAERAGVGKQTIYRWWRSKTAVVLESLAEMAEVDLHFPDTGSTREDLRHEMRAVVKTFRGPVAALVKELVAAAQGDPAVAADLRGGLFARRRAHVADTLRRGIVRGEVRAGLDLEAAADALYAPLWLRLLIEHQPLTASTADAIVAIVWPGIGVDGYRGRREHSTQANDR